MWLLLGVLFLSIGIIFLIDLLLLRKYDGGYLVKVIVSFVLLIIIGSFLIVTGSVHGIWLGFGVFVVGIPWVRYRMKRYNTIRI